MLTEEEKNHLAHYGVFGMKWGVRKYQNPDGSLTALGKERYSKFAGKDGKIYSNNDSYRYARQVEKLGDYDKLYSENVKQVVPINQGGKTYAGTIAKNYNRADALDKQALKDTVDLNVIMQELNTKYSEVDHTVTSEYDEKSGKIRSIVVTRLTDKYGKVYMTELESELWGDKSLYERRKEYGV